MRTVNIFTLLFILLAVFANAEASSTGISYHGRLLLPSGESVKANTQFRIQIRTPGNENCLMYEETTSRDLSLTDGVFSITIADGTGSRTDSLGLGLDAIFANRSKFVFTANCTVVTDYTPNAADGRRLQVSFNDGTFAGWEDLPVQNIGFAPISIESLQVGGFKASHLLRVADASGIPQPIAALTPAYFAELVALAAGTSTVYAKAGSAVSGDNITSGTIGGATIINTTGTIKGSAVSATTGGFNTVEVWKADNSNKVSIKASNSQSANYTLTLPVGAGTAGQVLSTDGTGVLSWSAGASLGASSGDVSGTYPSLTVTKIQGQAVSATTPVTGQALVFDGTSWAAKNFGIGDLKTAAGATQFATAACTAAQTLTWSSLTDAFTCADITGLKATSLAAGGVAGQILKIDGSGNLSWDADATGGGGGTPAGATSNIQFNNAGAFGGDSTLSFVSPGTLFVGTRPAGYSTDGNIYMYSGTSARSDLTLRNTSTGNTSTDGSSIAQVFSDLVIANYENGYTSFTTNNTERVRILANGSVGIGTTTPGEKLEVAGKVKATELCIGADCKAAWPTAGGSGTVTDVTSANAYLTVATGTTTPALTLNVGAVANTVAAGDDARFTDSRAPNGTAGGDLTGTYPNPTLAKISGNAITAGTIPGADIGKVYRWSGTALVPTFLNFGDLRTAAGAQQLTAACAANEKIQWSVITDAFTCQSIGSLNASSITAGTLDAARLPASATLWQDGGSNRIYYSTANVGIGVAAPATKLEVSGAIRLGTETLTCDASTAGTLRYIAASGGVELCNGLAWTLQTSGYPLPPSTTMLLDACPSGWTDIGTLGAGPNGANCNGVSCHRCQSPATAALLPAGTSALMDSCPANWTNAGVATGSMSAGYIVGYQSCAPPAASLIPTGTRLAMDSCPTGWTDIGLMNNGPLSAQCGGSSCHACEAPGAGVKPRALLGYTGVIGTDVSLVAGAATDGAGGRVFINAGNAGTTGSANNNGGDVSITSGSATGTGTAGNILLNSSTTGYTGIGISTPSTTLHIYSAQPSTISAPDRAGLIVDGEGTSYGARIAARAFSATEGAIFGGYRAMGPKSALSTVTSGKGLVSLIGYGYDGSNWSGNSSSPGITLESSEIWSGTAKGSRITFNTTANTTTAATERMRIDQNGNVGIGTGAVAPTALLEVNGTLTVAGASNFNSVTAGTGNFGTMNSAIAVVNGSNGWGAVMSLRNQSTTGFSGTFMTDTVGNNHGLLGYGNSASIFPGAIVLGSSDNATPLVFGVNSIETARISPTNGFFGIGTSNPLTPLHVDINAATAVATFENSTGSCSITPTTSSLSCSSDIRLKRNVENILGLTALNKIIQLQAKTYEWKGGDNSRHIGFIAQEAEKIVPELVTEDSKGYKQISYSGFVPLLSEAIKEVHQETESQKRDLASINEEKAELQKQVEALKKKNETLEQKNKEFEARLIKLEKLLAN
jgi:FtsZ-binding cell division protein ZapB